MSRIGTYVIVSKNEAGDTDIVLTHGEHPGLPAFDTVVKSVLGREPTDSERLQGAAAKLGVRSGAMFCTIIVSVHAVTLDPALCPGARSTPTPWGYETLGFAKSDIDPAGVVHVYADDGGCSVCEMCRGNSEDPKVNEDDAQLIVHGVNLLAGCHYYQKQREGGHE